MQYNTEEHFKILIVEDEIMVRQNIVSLLSKSNLEYCLVGEAENGFQALELIDEYNPHIVLTDICMPIMDGLQLVKEINFAYPSIRTAIITGYNEFEYAREALKNGVDDYILKPIKDTELFQTLNKIIIKLKKDQNLINIKSDTTNSISPDELAEIAKTYLQENYTKNIYLIHLAKKLGYSPDYIGKIFKNSYGISPIKYVTNLRINSAKNMLESSNEFSIKDMSELLGYSDQFYFSRVFKNITGLYPSNYRKSKLQNQ